MRILIKGGVWKNTEDEILKAAVMKYGKNGWSRVASLLNRKSARQCKARWYEWLDPSIKKTDWNKDEEEKLLHLAKLMPNQWRTIAPIVGRTAAQCMEHYERLLDQAQEETEETTDDPRRLRPGEIDPAPETKPARPDPIDMDEDEKEMLSEARARLANTLGKKAKRKARERQLGESRRLSMLQKRRELKAAGIESKLGGGNKKRKFIDYAKEIPFQKIPPAGFYEVNAENMEGKKNKLDPALHGLELAKMEGRHIKEEEEKNRAKDQRALKKLYKENAPLAVSKVSAENDPTSLRRRVPLSLPTPQISDGELEDIVKLGQNALMAPPTGLPTKGQALIADYSQQTNRTTLPTPSRTPLQEDIIMQEARNLRALRDVTPLFGEQEQDLPELYEGTGYGSIEPRKANLATPNTFLNLAAGTPSHSGVSSSGSVLATPGGASVASRSIMTSTGTTNSTSNHSVLRDPFGLNAAAANAGMHSSTSASSNHHDYAESDLGSVASTVRSSRDQGKFLLQQLKSLPEPEYIYEVAVPEQPSEEDIQYTDGRNQGTAVAIQDAAEVRTMKLAAERLLQEKELSRRSSVLKLNLPRPSYIDNSITTSSLSGNKYSAEIIDASSMINTEMLRILQHDTLKYPTNGKFQLENYQELDIISDDYLTAASEMLNNETKPLFNTVEGKEYLDNFNQLWEKLHKNLTFIPNSTQTGGGSISIPQNKTESIKSLTLQYTALKNKYDILAKRSNKIENKLQITIGGYIHRENQLQTNLFNNYDEYNRNLIELNCYQSLYKQEERALKRRLNTLRQDLVNTEDNEKLMQLKYAEMNNFKNEIISMK